MYKTILFGWKSDNKKVKFYDRTANSSQFKRNNQSDKKVISPMVTLSSRDGPNDTSKNKTPLKNKESPNKITPNSSRVNNCNMLLNQERKPGTIGDRRTSETLNKSLDKRGSFSKTIDVGDQSTELSRDYIRARINSASSQLENIEKSNNAILSHLRENNSLQIKELQNQLGRKNDELQRLKTQLALVKRRLAEQIEFASRGQQKLAENQNYQEKRIMQMTQTIQKLTKQLENSKKRRQSELIQDIQLSKIVYPIEPLTQSQDIFRLQQQNTQYESLVCDLHLQNNFYKSQLDKHGISKTTVFKEAYRKLLSAQARRKRL